MGRNTYRRRLSEFNLDDPTSKLAYTRSVFSAVALRYDVVTRFMSFGRDGRWKRLLVRGLPESKTLPRAVCLDLATGTGDILDLLADRYRSGTIDGVDVNPEMIVRAHRRTAPRRQSGFGPITIHLAEMSLLPFESARFDVVTGGYALRNASDLQATLREIYRVLKPGGVAAFLDFTTFHGMRLRRLQLRLLELWGDVWGALLHGNPEVYGYIARSLARFPDFSELPRVLGHAGLRVVRHKRLLGGMLALTHAVRE